MEVSFVKEVSARAGFLRQGAEVEGGKRAGAEAGAGPGPGPGPLQQKSDRIKVKFFSYYVEFVDSSQYKIGRGNVDLIDLIGTVFKPLKLLIDSSKTETEKKSRPTRMIP